MKTYKKKKPYEFRYLWIYERSKNKRIKVKAIKRMKKCMLGEKF